MPIQQVSLYQLLERMLNEGLPFVASCMEKQLKRPIIIADAIGRIHYPDEPGTVTSLDDSFLQIPSGLKEDEYSYDETNQILYYYIGQQRAGAYIVLKNLLPSMLPQALSVCNSEIKLAIKYYFSNLDKMRESQTAFKKELAEYLLFKSNANIRDIIKLSHKELDLNKPYLVTITEADQAGSEIDWEFICSHTSQHLKRISLEIIPIPWTNCMLAIFPASFKKDTLEIDPEWSRQIYINSFKFKDIIGNISDQTISIGIGRIYPLSDLHKSYFEARIAITLARLLGKTSFVQNFDELGIFSLFFSENIDVLKNYCQKNLEKLIDQDKKTDSELVFTLRQFMDHGFNRKLTADSLFVHINTVHYRIAKIEQILELDLSQTENRLNLFAAVKTYDCLRMNGFLD